jgi:hypothetical protein
MAVRQLNSQVAEAPVASAAAADAARACLYAVVDRFNTEDPFWGSFVPEPDLTRLSHTGFSVTLRGRGIEFEVVGALARAYDVPGGFAPTVVVGARPSSATPPKAWHPVTCTVDDAGRFITSNFRKAIEASIDDVRAHARS